MTHPPGGSAQPLLHSLDELGRTLDKTAADPRLPPAPAVKILHLPDVVPPRARSKPVAPSESASPWWVDVEPAPPQAAIEVVDAEPVVIGELVEDPPTPRRSWLIDWRLVGSTVAAAVAVLGVMVYGAWATTSRPAAAAKPAAPPLALLAKPQAAPVAQADVKLAEMEKKYQEIIARLESQPEAKPEPKPEPVVETKPQAVVAQPADTCYGTSVNFAGSPSEAATEAAASKKLMMVLTISGNFEESKFT
jgi:hypothetical protein